MWNIHRDTKVNCVFVVFFVVVFLFFLCHSAYTILWKLPFCISSYPTACQPVELFKVNASKCLKMVEKYKVHSNLIIKLSLGSIETDRVICEPCYNEVTFYRHIVKESIWEPWHGRVILKTALQ